MKSPDEYWYYFGKCTPYPMRISKGALPRMPYKRFGTKEECEAYIDSGETFNPMEEMLKAEFMERQQKNN